MTRIGKLLACALVLVVAPCVLSAEAGGRRGDAATDRFPAVERLTVDGYSGAPSWLEGSLGTLPDTDLAWQAAAFVKDHADFFHLTPADELELVRVVDDDLGRLHHRLQQFHAGLPVDGGDVYVHSTTDGAVYLVNGNLGADINPPPQPALAPEECLDREQERSSRELRPAIAGHDLVYFSRPEQPVRLAWRLALSPADSEQGAGEALFVDALSGETLERQSLARDALYRKVYGYGAAGPFTTLILQEGGWSADQVANAAYNNLGNAYNFFKTAFASPRDSYDGQGAQLKASVHYVFSGLGTTTNNAAWDSSLQAFLFGDGDNVNYFPFSYSPEVVVHEYTHAVTDYTAGLIGTGEPGAVDEAMADIFGAAAQAWINGTVNLQTWLHGDEIFSPPNPVPPRCPDATRYLYDPIFDGASKDYYRDRYVGGLDHGGVHVNSGIGNLAFYLLTVGGTHPNQRTGTVVPAIGIAKAKQIFYDALTTYLTSTSQFRDLADATTYAAGVRYSSAERQATAKAWAAVGVGNVESGTVELAGSQVVSNLSGTKPGWRYYLIRIPAGEGVAEFSITGSSGDCDIYVRRNAKPTLSAWDYRPYTGGSNEQVVVNQPRGGDWFIGLNAFSNYSGVTLSVSYSTGSSAYQFEWEPNDHILPVYPYTLAEETQIGQQQAHVVGYLTRTHVCRLDTDYYSIPLSGYQRAEVIMQVPPAKNYDLYLLDVSGAVVSQSTRAAGLFEVVTYQNSGWAPTNLYVKVVSPSGDFSHQIPYTLEVTRQ